MDFVLDLLSSPWVYLVVFTVAGLDSLVPIVPGETVLISAAAFSLSGGPHPLLLIGAGALGAVLGDFAAHGVGRGGGRVAHRLLRTPRLAGIRALLSRRGGTMLIVGRFVPGGRTVSTIGSGVLGYPRGRFLLFDGIGSLAWAVYSVLIGLIGGLAFEDEPLLGVALGIGIAVTLTGLIELFRRCVRSPRPAVAPV